MSRESKPKISLFTITIYCCGGFSDSCNGADSQQREEEPGVFLSDGVLMLWFMYSLLTAFCSLYCHTSEIITGASAYVLLQTLPGKGKLKAKRS